MGSASTAYMVRVAAEVASKSNRTRRRFQKQLVHNLGDALRSSGLDAQVRDRWSRIFVTVSDPSGASPAEGETATPEPGASDHSLAPVQRVFGVSSFSRVDATVAADLDEIVRTGHDLYREQVSGRRFAVAPRRTGRHPFSSRDIGVQLGAALNPYGTVDLTSPEVTVSVEVRDQRAYLHCGRTDGPGGLPVGVQSRAVCLISGGYDSAVAAWLLLKRGVALDYVFCNLAGPAFERSALRVARVLTDRWSYGHRPRLHAIDFAETVRALQRSVTPRYWQVILKRLMYRGAEAVARDLGAEALVTGESLGQVSSQTLPNLRAIESVATLPVLRPLVGFDKEEIIRIAKGIGTAALSARVREYCAILAGKPVTAAKTRAVDREEAPLDPGLVDRAVATRKVLDVRGLAESELRNDYLWVDRPPAAAHLIDCRPPQQDDGWRHPRARRVAPADFPELAATLSREAQYVLYCDNGVQSVQFADILQTAGFEAYALREGTKALKSRAG